LALTFTGLRPRRAQVRRLDDDAARAGWLEELEAERAPPAGRDDDAVRLANDSVYGLTASVWTSNLSRGKRIAERIDAGTVMINEALYSHGIAQTPWGGVKQSGFGRTHGRTGLLELVNAQHIHVNHLWFIPDLWWFNYTPQAGRLFRGFARRFASGSILQASLLLPQMIRRWLERRD